MRWFWSRDTLIDSLIRPPVYKWTTFDPDVQQKTKARRLIADRIRAGSARVDSGSSAVGDMIRMVKP